MENAGETGFEQDQGIMSGSDISRERGFQHGGGAVDHCWRVRLFEPRFDGRGEEEEEEEEATIKVIGSKLIQLPVKVSAATWLTREEGEKVKLGKLEPCRSDYQIRSGSEWKLNEPDRQAKHRPLLSQSTVGFERQARRMEWMC